LDDGGFTPPHGDPLGDAALDPPAPLESPPPAPDLFPSEAATAAASESAIPEVVAADVPVTSTLEPPDLLYSGPVEPAPAGDLLPDPEPVQEVTAAPLAAVAVPEAGLPGRVFDEPAPVIEATVLEEPVIAADDQPELLYAGPVEAAPAGLHFPEPEAEGAKSEPALRASEPQSFPSPVPHDELEAAALASEAVAVEPPLPDEPELPVDGGPNWMLAFICAWSSAISLREAWATVGGGSWGLALRNLGVMGYLLLGVGLIAFALDALRWGRPRRGAGALVIPTLLTLAGVVCLVLWNDRGRPI
jgi:hypothetical protein